MQLAAALSDEATLSLLDAYPIEIPVLSFAELRPREPSLQWVVIHTTESEN
jgi:hypothetical protein